MGKQRAAPGYPVAAPKAGNRHLGLVISVVVLGAYLALGYFVLKELPWVPQKLLGLGCAALAVVVYLMATRRSESTEDLLFRLRRAQHSEFGRQRMQSRPKPRTVKLPWLGETSARALGGAGVFLAVFIWWWTPWAPVTVKKLVAEDLTILFGEEIVSAVLVMPTEQMAIVQPPVLPQRARELSGAIRDDADPYQRGLKAIAEGRFEQARELLKSVVPERGGSSKAEQPKGEAAKVIEPHEIYLAQAQNEMFAGQFDAAAGFYEKAKQTRPDDPLLWCQQAVARIQSGDFSKAEPLLKEAEKICREKLSEKDPARAVCLHVQAVLCVCLGKEYEQAERRCLQAREIFQQAYGQRHPLVGASLNNQATLYLLRGNYSGAENLYKDAGDVWAAGPEPKHPRTAAAPGNLGMLHHKLGWYEATEDRPAAAEELQEALAICRAGLRKTDKDALLEHPILAAHCTALAVSELGRGQYADARKDAEDALAIAQRQMGAEHPCVAAALDTLAAIDTAQARRAKAEAGYDRALKIVYNTWGLQHPYYGAIRNHQAVLVLAQGRDADADTSAQRALEIAEKAFGRQHCDVAAALETLGEVRARDARDQDARRCLKESLEIRQKLLGKEHPDIARTLGHLAAVEQDYKTGVQTYGSAIEMAKKFLGEGHPDVARLLVGLAKFHAARERYKDARRCLDEAWDIQDKLKPSIPNNPDLAETLETYAKVLRQTSPANAKRAAKMEAEAEQIRSAHAKEDRL
jgi:Flp pilus assembly protein TadD